MKRASSVVAAAASLVAACSTAVDSWVPLSEQTRRDLQVTKVQAVVPRSLPADIGPRLELAVSRRLAEHRHGERPVELKLQVTTYNIVDPAMRFWLGAIGGQNRLYVTAQVIDRTGERIAEYNIRREANPGGFGAFYDQGQATIEEAADGIVSALLGGD